MMLLTCDDTLNMIYQFLTCPEAITMKVVNDFFSKNIICKGIRYKCLFGCSKHNNDASYVISILNMCAYRKYIDTMHFESTMQMELAEPYLTDFGKISHKCCYGKGVMFSRTNNIKPIRLDQNASTNGFIENEPEPDSPMFTLVP